jgi:hypothetical protein
MQRPARAISSLSAPVVPRLWHQGIYYRRLIFVLALCLAACTSQETRPALNSERIQQAFGSYGVDVLSNNENQRISSLYSLDGNDKTTRTYAVVDFIGVTPSALESEHALIQSGQSIGEVFREAGWTIAKRHQFIGEFEVPAAYVRIGKLMRVILPQILAADVYVFVVSRDDRSYTYATITEIHHPDYLSASDLNRIYGEILFDDSNRRGIEDYIGPPAGHQ